jgi:hypothetical protein
MDTQTILTTAGVVVAAAAAFIAWQQWLTNRNQFLFQLYDRRIPIYDAIMEFAALIIRTGTVTQEQLRDYLHRTRGTSFIFDDQVEAYCDELYKKAIEIWAGQVKIDALPEGSVERGRSEALKLERVVWFNDQFDSEIKPFFKPFLQIREGFLRRRKRNSRQATKPKVEPLW